MRRFALIALHFATQYTNVEKSGLFKPFNPLLGETYELVKPGEYKFLAE
jgi:Oxysterol-binding protein